MSKRVLSFLLVVVLVVSLFVGCAPKNEESETLKDGNEAQSGATKDQYFRVGFVTDVGGIDDRSFNQGTYEGILKYAEEKGWEHGKEYNYIPSNEEADYIPNLSTFGDENYNVIIAAGYKFEDSMNEVAPRYPDTSFAIIDMIIDEPNVASVVFAEEQGSFLVGVAAAESTKTKKVGFVGGEDFPLIRKFHAGFIAGVHSVDDSIEVYEQYAGSFADTGMGQQIASLMYEKGVDVIYHAAGGTGNGVINEAKNRADNGEEVWVIGVDKDQYEDGKLKSGKSIILTSMMKRVDVASYKMIEAAQKGEFPGGKITEFTLAEEGVGIPRENPNLSEDIVNEIKDYENKIIKGEITVPTTMEELEAFKDNL
ncbi:MAG: BMP family protein [Clostridia bacterium]|nr:BMP family protein [Clostridia bacterium]